MRLELRELVLPHDDRLVQRARVRDDARDEHADVVQVRDEHLEPARAVQRVGHRLPRVWHRAARREWEGELHPPADVDVRVRHTELLDQVADLQFLRG